MFKNQSHFHGQREPPSFNAGHRSHQQPPSSYQQRQPSFDEDYDDYDDEWDESDEDVYLNDPPPPTSTGNVPPSSRRDRQPLPNPGRPPHNPINDHHPTRPPPTNYPPHRPFKAAAPPLQPRNNQFPPQPNGGDGDDMYLPIDPSQEVHRGPASPPSRPHTGYNPGHKPGPVTPSRPSFPPPASAGGRPPIPAPGSMLDPGSDRPSRADWNSAPTRNSRNNLSSPRSSPGPPSRDGSGRSSGGRNNLPRRGGSGGSRSSQDSIGSGDRGNVGRPPYQPHTPSETPPRGGGFELFKGGIPGFPNRPDKSATSGGGLPQLSKKPDKPAKPSGFANFDRKPISAPKPGKIPPVKEKPVSLGVNTELAEKFSKNLPGPSDVPSNQSHAASRLPFFKKRPVVERPVVERPVVERPVKVEQQAWYKDVSRGDAQSMIERGRPKDGCFIVRPGRPPNPYSMTVYKGGMCNLVIRRRSDDYYALGNEKASEKAFPSVIELIDYHMENALVLADGKGDVKLIGPP